MISSFLALLPVLIGFAAVQGVDSEPGVRRAVVAGEVILRVPVRPRTGPGRFHWVEAQGFRCINSAAIRGAVLSGPENVDFVLRRQRVRASFGEDCPALDFYDGFYLKMEDDRVCARRDFIHSRMGRSCRIEGFRRLVPTPRH